LAIARGRPGFQFQPASRQNHTPPPVGKPDRVGFGSTLIEKGFTVQMGGSATLRYERDGLTCALEFPPH
jgi:two-component sensor histidine kinase